MNNYLNIKGRSEQFLVNNIFCVGKNYLNHIKEFGSSDAPESPVIFFKPNSAIVKNQGIINVPEINGKKISNDVHYETELVVAIGKDCKNINESEALDYILGYGIGLDLTLRDVQAQAKRAGLPWGTAKGFRNSAPISDLVPRSLVENPMNLEISLKINNSIKQFSNTSLMIFNIYKLVSYISSVFELSKGDLIFTGTPEGVGRLEPGDELIAELKNVIELKVFYNG